ncbi:hypothetical protein [Kitasatospora sp. NPDC088346]|uniref:hypothetical protein n=1 Tax=Kitasatospora sp. NPDC088346 TaxID=3364073 RepID=UPI0038035B8C
MSLEPMIWVLSGDAPIADLKEFAVLATMSETASRDGCGTFQSKETIAERTTLDTESVKRAWRSLTRRGLIAKGDQSLARHIRADRRPVVYDLLIPYDWFPNIERTNQERARMGLDPLTPKNRPPIAPAPGKTVRSDKGKPRARKSADLAGDGSTSRGNSETPREETPEPSHGGTTSRRRGNYKSSTGELQEPQTSTSNPSTEPATPPVPPSIPDPDACASANADNRTDGRTDGGEVVQEQREQTGGPVAGGGAAAPAAPVAPQPAGGGVTGDATPARASAAPAASAGVMLLLSIGATHPELRVFGPALADQGAELDLRLAAGWPVEMLRAILTAPGKDPVRDAASVIAWRIKHLPVAPAAVPADAPVLPQQAPRTVAQELGRRTDHECPGQDGQCGRPVNVAGELCPRCKTPCSAGCGRSANPARLDALCSGCARQAEQDALPRCADGCGRPVNPADPDGRCVPCAQALTDAELPRCVACGNKPAVRTSGHCADCHHAAKQQEAAEAELARAQEHLGLPRQQGPVFEGGCLEGLGGCRRAASHPDGRCDVCHEAWTAYQQHLDEYAPAYAQEGASAPF